MKTSNQDGQMVRTSRRRPSPRSARVVPTPFTDFEVARYDTLGLSNVFNVIRWCMDQWYKFSLVHRDPHDETIPRELWPLSLHFRRVCEAVHFRLMWQGRMRVCQG
jgi:hypothetical protein